MSQSTTAVFNAAQHCKTFGSTPACGPNFIGLPFLSGLNLVDFEQFSGVSFSGRIPFIFDDENAFNKSLFNFANPNFNNASTFDCVGIDPHLRYLESFFCSAVVFVANLTGCSVDLSVSTVCDDVCQTAYGMMYNLTTIDACNPTVLNGTTSEYFTDYVNDMSTVCQQGQNYLFSSINQPTKCSLGSNGKIGNELDNCGFLVYNATYCQNDGYNDWCCEVAEHNAQYALFDSNWQGFTVHWNSSHTGSFELHLIIAIACLVVALFAIVIGIHVFNSGRRRDSEGEEVDAPTFSQNLLNNAKSLNDFEGPFPKESIQPDYASFFSILGVSQTDRSDAEKFFDLDKLGWGQTTGRSTPAVDPWAPLSDEHRRPPVLALADLSKTSYDNKIASLGSIIQWFNLKTFTKKHYELGNCLVVQAQTQTKEKTGKKFSKMFIYQRFDTFSGLIQGVVATVLVTICFLLVAAHLIGTIQYPNPDPYTQDVTPKITLIQGIVGEILATISNFYISIAAALLLVVYTYALFSRSKPQPGLLKYLRQVGLPQIEEVMISYSWEVGISENARGLAHVLYKSGLRAWIDVLKLETADNTANTTRTVAKHTRFVVIYLTEQYLQSPACFIEFLEALSAPNPTQRLIVFAPKISLKTKSRGSEEASRVKNVAERLLKAGILVLDDHNDFIQCINDLIIHSSHQSHLFWWQNYKTEAAGIPYEAIVPTKRQAPQLKRWNLRIFGELVGRNPVQISNIWLRSSLRKTGTRASSIPWLGLLNAGIFIMILADLSLGVTPFLIDLWYSAVDSSVDSVMKTKSVAASIITPVSHISQVWFEVCCQIAILGMMLAISSLSGNVLFDNRSHMTVNLHPLIASFNFRQRKFKKYDTEARKRMRILERLQSRRKKIEHQQIFDKKRALHQIITAHTEISALPRVKVLVYDFGTSNEVASTLKTFLGNIDMLPETNPDFSHPNFNFGHSTSGFEIYVPVFIFGANTAEEVAKQVQEYGRILEASKLSLQDCVIVAAHPTNGKKEVQGLFQSKFTLRNINGEAEQVNIGQFLILVETFYVHNEFASEVIFHIGLRVNNALKRITRASLQEDLEEARLDSKKNPAEFRGYQNQISV
ncbi:hypothetical protein HK100_009379 [Physocladia obscura]|uniref:TIR domain-containing protein n=1 Tax=Physocladia obscura TaxID=109957 RepID=A0AAD5T990_9FUNG|nr:hypothetical protein HK100_009379 [Physocladia obscura]